MSGVTYKDLETIMAANHWEYDGKNFSYFGEKASAQLKNNILSTLGVDEKTFTILYKTHLKNVYNEAKTSAGSIDLSYKNIPFVHPWLLTASWNAGDRLFWDRFRFASRGDNVILLIAQGDGGYKCVDMGGREADTIAAVHKALQSTTPTPGQDYPNLDVELISRYQKMMDQCAKSASSADALAEWACKYVPSTLLTKHNLMLCVYQEIEEVNGKQKIKLTIPHMAFFQIAPGNYIDPVTHLVSDWEHFLKYPEMHAPMPKMFSNDPGEAALNFLDLNNIVQEGECPTWHKFLERFSADDAEVLKAFLYSIVNVRNAGRQLLYIYDKDGYSGKSVMFNALASLLPERCVQTIQKDSLSNQFGLSKLYGKRLVIIPDNKNTKLIKSEKMHMVLGGDSADIEFKGENSFQLDKIECRIIAAGNVPLEIDPYADHEVSRLIVIKTNMTKELLAEICETDEDGELVVGSDGKYKRKGDSSFATRLKTEAKYFMSECKVSYERLCPTDADIICADSVTQNIFDMVDPEIEVFNEMLNKYFIIGSNQSMTPVELMKQYQYAVDEMEINRVQKIEYAHFRTYLVKRNLIKKSSARSFDGQIVTVMRGISARPDSVFGTAQTSAQTDITELF